MSNGQYQQPQPQQRPIQYQPGMSVEDVSSEQAFPLQEPGFLKARIETNTILQDLKKQLQGKTKDAKGNYIKLGEPLMNDEGINVCMSIIMHYVNPTALFSELERNDINEMCYGLSNDMTVAMVSNMSEWKIKDLPLVKRAIVDFVFMSLLRALNRGEAKSIGNLTTASRTVVVPQEHKSRLNIFRRGQG